MLQAKLNTLSVDQQSGSRHGGIYILYIYIYIYNFYCMNQRTIREIFPEYAKVFS